MQDGRVLSTIPSGRADAGGGSVHLVVPYAAGWHRHLEFLAAHLDGHDRPWSQFWAGYDDLAARYRR